MRTRPGAWLQDSFEILLLMAEVRGSCMFSRIEGG